MFAALVVSLARERRGNVRAAAEVVMRSAGNFHPEWGYLAPAPSFMRSVRIALVAAAIGGIAGAAVIVSLVDHPGANNINTSIAAHALVTTNAPVVTAPTVAASPFGKAAAAALAAAKLPPAQEAATAPSAPQAKIEAKTEAKAEPVTAPKPVIAANASRVTDTASAPSSPVGVAGLPDEAPPPDTVPAVVTDARVANAAAARRRRIESYQARRRWEAANIKKHSPDDSDNGLAALFHIFGGPSAN
jgi:hypothetical protein